MDKACIGEVLISETQIELGVSSVAEKINRNFDAVTIISVVPGGMLFTADLVRKLTIQVKLDHISCPHTPGDRENNSDIVFHEHISLAGRDVILVDDAIESGGTMKRLVEYVSERFSVNSLSIATLFVKKARANIDIKQYYAYELDSDELLLGYGLPWQDHFRNLPYVARLTT